MKAEDTNAGSTKYPLTVSYSLDIKRLINILKAELSYALSLFGIVRVRHLPTFVSVEPANFCQLHCPECPVGKRENASKKVLTITDFKRLLEQVKGTVHTMQFFFQGEPLLNKDLPQMIQLAHEAGLFTIVSTNALAVTPLLAKQLMQSGLNRIIVSIDGLSEESYGAYRVGGSLHKAMEGLIALRHAKNMTGSRTHIELQMLRLRTNENEWSTISQRYRKMGADSLTLKTAQLYDYQHGHPLMPTDEKYSRYIKRKDGLYHLKRKPGRSCHRLWTGCVITVNGDVLPCCYDKTGQYSFGNIFTSSLSDIYHSDKANRFRKSILRKRSSLSICSNCEP